MGQKIQTSDYVKTNVSVTNYVRNCSQEKKLVAPLFDFNKNGKFDEEEAKLLNRCTFSKNGNNITISLNNEDNTKIKINYENVKDLKDLKIGRPELIIPFINADVEVRDKNMCRVNVEDDIKEVTLDYKSKTTKVRGNGSNAGNISVYSPNCEISDTRLSFINLYENVKKANLNNVKTYSYAIAPVFVNVWNSKTQINTNNTKINVDRITEPKKE